MRPKRNVTTTILILVVITMSCQLPFLAPRPKPAADMKITDSVEVSIENATILDRSPDGRWLIVYTYPNPPESEFCIYRSKNIEPVFCMPEQQNEGITLRPVSWSPDSTKLVMTEYMTDIPIDTDIWVLNIETKNLENITDDGASGILTVHMDPPPYLDNAPAWSPDGIWLAISRTTYDTDTLKYETALYKVPALGGEAEKIAVISDEAVAIPNGQLSWLKDDSLIYTPRPDTISGKIQGLTAIHLDGSQDPEILEELGPDIVGSSLLSVSPDSKHALVLHEVLHDPVTTYVNINLFNLVTGESTPLKKSTSSAIPEWFKRSNWAAFSPDGSKVAFIYESPTPSAQWRLALMDIGSEEEVVLQSFDARKYYVNYPFRWCEDDAIMIRLVEYQPPFPIQLLTVK
jgi:hypothetical protein